MRKQMGGHPLLVESISEAELAQNGGPYRLVNGNQAIPVRVVARSDGGKVRGGQRSAVFVVNNLEGFAIRGGPALPVSEVTRVEGRPPGPFEAVAVYVVDWDDGNFEPCHDLDWRTIDPYDWYDFQECMQATNESVTGGTDRVVTQFGSLSGTLKWTTGPLLPDGRVIGIPHDSTQIILVDPVGQTTTLFGSLAGANKWIGGVLLPDGRVCSPPLLNSDVLLIDPVSQTTEVFGNIPGTARRATTALLMLDGRVLCAPNELDELLLIDPVNQTHAFFGSLPPLAAAKSINGVLLRDGRACITPANYLRFILADTDGLSVELIDIPANGGGNNSWGGGVLLPDGRVCCVPLGATKVLLFDPYTQDIEFFGNLAVGQKWVGATLLPDGKVLGIPHSTNQYLLVDPIAQTTELFGNISGSNRYEGGTLLPDGRVCSIPLSQTQVAIADLGYSESYNSNVLLSTYLNGKF